MEKITITRITRSWKDKTGKDYIGQNGRPYERVGIQTREYQERWLSGFGNKQNQDWKVGDIVDIEKDEVIKDDKTYLNFKTPDKLDLLEARVARLEAIVNQRSDEPEDDGGHIEDDNSPEDLPF